MIRSLLYVPASAERFIAKAHERGVMQPLQGPPARPGPRSPMASEQHALHDPRRPVRRLRQGHAVAPGREIAVPGEQGEALHAAAAVAA